MTTSHPDIAADKVAWVVSNDPGSWSATHDGFGNTCYQAIRDAYSGQVIALVVDHQPLGDEPDTREAARLIAAAPDLLAACLAAFHQTCSVGRPKDWEQLRAAIEKASPITTPSAKEAS